MDYLEAQNRVKELTELIRLHTRRYYVENSPTISDFEFDALMRELEVLEKEYPLLRTPDSPTQKVGSDLSDSSTDIVRSEKTDNFIQRPHKYPMLSLGNTYNITEIEEFAARADKTLGDSFEEDFTYCCELKFDGTAICLTYRDGKLVQALTRGDGIKGDDVTENVRQIYNIPQTLHGDFPPEFEIRGEILMPYGSFNALNNERSDNDEPLFANPRNAASGSLKLTNPSEVEKRGLWCTLYHIPAQSITFATHDEALNKAYSWGLPVSDKRKLCRNIDEIKAYIDYWDEARRDLPYATDGIVIKINELAAQRILGYTAKSPRWAVAFKFKAEQACTKVLSVSYQVGRTGAVTPVANLDPVPLGGTVVKRATLNNAEWMSELDVRVGDMVYVEKGGEIIPKITAVNLNLRQACSVAEIFPTVCPDCGTPLVKEDDEAKWFCPNQDGCPMQIKGRLIHFAGRKAMNILAGEATFAQFYGAGLVRTPADLYDISLYQLLSLEGWQEKSATKFIDSLAQTVNVPFERVLFALGIRYVGETTAKSLAKHFRNIDSLASAELGQILEVEDVGEVIAKSVYDFLHSEAHLNEIVRLRSHGVRFSSEEEHEPASEVLKGMSIVVSGNFSISRDAIKELVEKHGGKCSSSVSARTTFLLSGTKSGPEKLKKCEELGIRTVSESEFMEMISEPSSHSNDAEPVQLSLF